MGDSFNKILSFILGIIVVIILISIISRRMNLGSKITFLPLADKPTPTSIAPKPTQKPKPTITFFQTVSRTPNTTKGGFSQATPVPIKTVKFTQPTQTVAIKEIPNTGPEFLLPLTGLSLLVGVFLRKRS